MIEENVEHTKMVEAWYKAEKKYDLRLNYPLNENSVVFDLGAYNGSWAKAIYNRFNCRVVCFEPVTECFEQLEKNVGLIDKINIHKFGIKSFSGFSDIYVDGNASSIYNIPKERKELEHIQVMSILDIMNNYNYVDLIKMNVEGDEYEILDSIIDNDLVSKFRYFQIQFHRDLPGYNDRRNRIISELKKTHEQQYCFDYVWESWEAK